MDTTYDSSRGALWGTSFALAYDYGKIFDYQLTNRKDVGGNSWSIEAHNTRMLLERATSEYGPVTEVVHDDCGKVCRRATATRV